MAEQYRSDAELTALSGTTQGAGAVIPGYNLDPHYTNLVKFWSRIADAMVSLSALEVFKDGTITFGVRAGKYFDGDTLVEYAGATDQALTNNQTNYIYLTAAGVLTVNTTGFPVPSVTPHISLATIVTAGGAYSINDGDITDCRDRSLYRICGASSGAMNDLDWQESVADELDFTAAEPAAPSTGDRYLNTGSGASSETGQTVAANDIEEWNGTSWTEITPTEGACCLVEDRDMLIGFNASSWVDLGTFANIKDLTDGGNADALHEHTLAAGATDVTATAAEVNLNDGAIAGTAVASKTVALGADKDLDEIHLAALYLGAGAGTLVTATAALLNEAGTFFSSTNISGAEAETLSDGSNADAMHVHDTAGLTDRAVTDAKRAHTTVEANTAGSGSPNILTADESRKVLTNEGATEKNYETLPTAAAGLLYIFVVQDSDGIRITAAAGDTIRVGSDVSAAGGHIESTTVGASVTLLAINATEWVAIADKGAW